MSNAVKLAAILEEQYELFDIIKDSLDKVGSSSTIQRIESRKAALCENWKNFKQNHQAITSIKAALNAEARLKCEEEDYFREKKYRNCEENFLNSIEHMSTLHDKLVKVPDQDGKSLAATSANQLPTFHNHQLPKLPLPVFNGEFSEWPSFKDSFMAIIGADPTLTCVTKLQFLKGCLVGRAATRLDGVSITASNFQVAWDDMISYYDNKRLHVDSAVQSIISAKAVDEESSSKLETLYNEINKALGSLEGLGRDVSKWNDVLTHIVSRKLDGASVKEWENSLGSSTEPPTWAKLKDFILTRIRSLQAFERATSGQSISKFHSLNSKQQTKAKAHHAAAQHSKQVCVNCKGEHYISSCPGYLSKSPEDRVELVEELRLCYNCLGSHTISACFSKWRCQKCGGRHHTTIHQPNTSIDSVSSVPINQDTSTNNNNRFSASSNVTCINQSPRPTTLLATALVKVISSSGEPYVVRAFLDQGSEVNLISEYLIHLLNIPRSYSALSIVGIGGDSSLSHQSKGLVSINLQSCINDFDCSFNAYVLSKLTNFLPSAVVKPTNWPHLQNIDLADPEYYQPGRVDLILGAEVYGEVLQSGLIKGPEGAPIAQSTRLGWIISGSSSSDCTSKPKEAMSFHCYADDHLDEIVKKFWMQEESFNSSIDALTPEEMECEDIFTSTHSRDSEGRFIVRLPFKSIPTSFGDSRTPALKLLYRMNHRFTHNPEFATNYSNFIAEYEQLGHMKRESSPIHQTDQMFYLPHHGVLRSSSSTTKLRVVFNGSLKTDKGTSLNDFLHEGQKLQVDLPDVLTRWRVNEFAYSADVTKMFRQIKVHPDDWNYQRILWTEGCAVQEFVLTTVTYGTKSAPFLAIRVLNQLAEDESDRFSDVKDVIKKNTYVDDVYDGAATVEMGKNRIKQISNLFKAGGFHLQKWTANNQSLIAEVPEQYRAAPSSSHCIDDGPVHRTLGLNWQPKLDRFIFIPTKYEEPAVYTKRIVLSKTAQLFDPLGWLSPIVVRAKLFIQELWLADLEWDQPISKEFELRWRSYINQLNDLSLISVPRWLGITPGSLSIELHGFSDASQAALGAVVYIRVISENGANITILSSKTKVTPGNRPLKSTKRPRSVRITTPRLELAAALLLTKLVKHFISVLNLQSVPIHLWTDSSTSMYWIQGDPSRWKDFVRNRVKLIQDLLPEANWHHIPGENNPADLASRGSSPRQLAKSSLWWQGPKWLQLTADKWPNLIPTPDVNVDCEERQLLVATVISKRTALTWDLVQRYSSLSRLLRITAWCKRIASFRKLSSSSHRPSPLTPAEIREAKLFWINNTQNIYFKSEINHLSRLESLPRSSSLRRLTPFIDSQGTLRIGGRLRNAQIDPDMKHPIILPRDSIFTNLVLNHIHRTTLHGGVQLMLATLRRSYWILGGRSYVRSFVHRCVICARHRAATSKQLMGQLPVSRTILSRPFLHSGVDYAGPFILKTWRGRAAKTYKAYLIVFICFSSSAVHLELATDYSTEGFLAAYKRFVSRRGICATLTSDCGTNLVGADAELRKLFKSTSRECRHIIDMLANDGTKWQFNPPAAPHFGGKWEAAVKSAKFHIKRTIGESLLTYEEFSTLLSQIEAVLNSRPICPMSDDPEDIEALTPGHFIIGSAINTVPESSLLHIPESRLSRYQHLRQMLERFWQRWSIQYLQRLQEFCKWHDTMPSIKVGTLVLVVDERYPPTKWPLARVVETHPGSDGLVRVVTVRTQSSTLKRPIVKLCPLPVYPEDQEVIQRSKGDVEAGGMLKI